MSGWMWLAFGYGLLAFGSLFLLWACGRIGAQHDTEPYDDMVDVVSDPELDMPDCDCEDCDDEWDTRLDEAVLRAQMDYDAYRFSYKLPGEQR